MQQWIEYIPNNFVVRSSYWSNVWLNDGIKNVIVYTIIDLGWGLLSQFPPFRYFPYFSASPKYMLAIEYHVHIWQVSAQLSCGDICQLCMWCEESNIYFSKIDDFAWGALVTPTPVQSTCKVVALKKGWQREILYWFCTDSKYHLKLGRWHLISIFQNMSENVWQRL